MIEKIERNVRAGIPVDTVVADIDYMDRYKDFTIGKVHLLFVFVRLMLQSSIEIFLSFRAGSVYLSM